MIGVLLFVSIFLIIYGTINFIFYRAYTKAYKKGKLLLGIYLLIQTFLPVIWRILDRSGFTAISPILAFTSLVWMGFVIYFFISYLIIKLISFKLSFDRKIFFLSCLIISSILSIYSYIETLNPETLHYIIRTNKLPEGKKLRILHTSDLHLGPLMREYRINIVREAFERYKPHILVVTGDFVDGNMKDLMYLADMLSTMKPPLGKYSVTGNHEFYVGYEQAIEFMRKAGFRVLRGEHVDLGYVIIAGVDDDEGLRRNSKALTEEDEVLRDIDTSKFVILLKHKPIVNRKIIDKIDLQLSGHTHGGVLFFIGYLVLDFMFETNRGIKEIGNNKYIIVSKGVGTGGPPMRLLSPPDVVIVDIVGTSKTKGKLGEFGDTGHIF